MGFNCLKATATSRRQFTFYHSVLRNSWTSKHQKMVTFARNCSVKMTLRLFLPLSVVMTMVPRLLRKFRISLQIKKSITNAPCVL